MSGGLIPANLRRQVTALGQGEPADRAVAKVVERESVLEADSGGRRNVLVVGEELSEFFGWGAES